MNTVDGYAMSSWDRGYGDFAMVPDLSTLRRVPWQPATVMALSDLAWLDGSGDVLASPRQILRRQLDRLAGHGLTAYAGTELEFVLYRTSYEDAQRQDYRNLEPANLYNIDYSLLGTARVEPLLRRIRNEMAGAGLVPESAKGECNLGQHEIAFRYAAALAVRRQPRDLQERRQGDRGPGGHVDQLHGQAQPGGGQLLPHPLLAARRRRRVGDARRGPRPPVRRRGSTRWPGCWPRCATSACCSPRTSTPTSATSPARSRRPRCAGGATTAPARCGWSATGRACGWRTGCRARTSTRTSRSRAWSRASLHGIEHELPLEREFTGNAYGDGSAQRVPSTLREAAELWEGSAVARAAFGDEVVAHYANNARVELTAFDAAVTDWELRRGFERL